MKQVKNHITKISVNLNSHNYKPAITFFITLLLAVILSLPNDVRAQIPLRVLVNADNDTVSQVSGKNALIKFKGVFHGIGGISFPFGKSEASAVSTDGSVVIGTSQSIGGIDEAFRWNAGVLEPLGTLPGGNESAVIDISADGSVAVGYSTISNGLFEAFRWTEAGGMEGLGFLHSGEAWSEALGVSADGSVVVGDGSSEK